MSRSWIPAHLPPKRNSNKTQQDVRLPLPFAEVRLRSDHLVEILLRLPVQTAKCGETLGLRGPRAARGRLGKGTEQ